MMIKYILEEINSKRDGNGNCYHKTRVTSVTSGKFLMVYADGQRNVYAKLRDMLGLDHGEIKEIDYELRYNLHGAIACDCFECELTKEMIEELDGNAPQKTTIEIRNGALGRLWSLIPVEVRDYDTDGIEDSELKTDEEGKKFVKYLAKTENA